MAIYPNPGDVREGIQYTDCEGNVLKGTLAVGPTMPKDVNALQWFLDERKGRAYADELIDRLPVLRPLEAYDSFRAPRSGRAYQFDNSARVEYPGAITNGHTTLTIMMRTAIPSGSAMRSLVVKGPTTWELWAHIQTNGTLHAYWMQANSAVHAGFTTSGSYHDGVRRHYAFEIEQGVGGQTYVDGVAVAGTNQLDGTFSGYGGALFCLGRRQDGLQPYDGQIDDFRVYSGKKTTQELAAIVAGDYDNPDIANALLIDWCNVEDGTTSRDASGNGNHGTIVNATLSNFHLGGLDIPNPANSRGHTLTKRLYGDGTGSWGSTGWLSDLPLADGESVRFLCTSITNTNIMFGVTASDTAPFSFTALSVGVQQGSGGFAIWSNGASQGLFGTQLVDGDIITMTRSGTDVQVSQNGALVHTVTGIDPTMNVAVTQQQTPASVELFAPYTGTLASVVITQDDGRVIHRDESSPDSAPLDVTGNALQYPDQCPFPACVDTPWTTWNGVDEYIMAPHLAGGETVVSSNGDSVPSISAGRIDFTAGNCGDLLLSDGTRYVLQEGAGNTVHDAVGSNHGTIVGNIANVWAARTRTQRDWCIENGGSGAAWFSGGSSGPVIEHAGFDPSVFTDQATMLVRCKTVEYPPVGNTGMVTFDGSGSYSHYPFQDGNAYFAVFRDTRIDSISLAIPTTEEHWLAIVHGPSEGYKVYQDNNLIVDQPYGTFTIVDTPSNFRFGGTRAGERTQGYIYKYGVYNKEMTAAEIAAVVSSNQLPTADAVIRCDLNNNFSDSSGNGNDPSDTTGVELAFGLGDGTDTQDLLPGRHGNPNSRIDYDHWAAGELADLLLPADTAPGELLRNDTPLNCKFRSEIEGTPDPQGDHLFFNVLPSLTGTDLDDAIEYISGSTTLNCDYPDVADVRDQVTYDNGLKVGTLDLPAETDVRDAVQYDNSTKTGNVVLPTEPQVLETIQYGANGTQYTGTLDPDAVANIPAVGDVRDGVFYGEGSAKEGVLNIPAISDVRLGVSYDNATKTGNVRVPAVGDVRDQLAYDTLDSLTGVLDVPLEKDVRTTIQYDNNTKTGNIVLPLENLVYVGTGYGSNGTEFTGTLDPDITANVPIEADVRNGVTYGDEPILTGTLVVPAVGDVQLSVVFDNGSVGTFAAPATTDVRDQIGFGAGGTEFTGSLVVPAIGDVEKGVVFDNGSVGTFGAPTESQVLLGIGFGASDTEFLGNVRLPLESTVLENTLYGPSDTLTGTLVPTTFNLPSVNDVRLGVIYGDSNQFTGTVRVPPETKVELGYQYDANDSLTGQLSTQIGVVPDVEDVRFNVEYGEAGAYKYGVLLLPVEANVLLGVGYGAYGTEFEGTLQDISGGTASPLTPILISGALRSPLIIGNAYTGDFAFQWQINPLSDYDPGTATIRFRGWAACSCDTLVWDIEGTITDNTTSWDLVFEMPPDISGLIESGEYEWSVEIDDLRLTGSVEHPLAQWVC